MNDCVPTGHTLSVNVADIAMCYIFNKLIYSDFSVPIPFKSRFVDDETLLWMATVSEFSDWISILEGWGGSGLKIFGT